MNPWDNDKPAVAHSAIGAPPPATGLEQAPAREALPWVNDKPAVTNPTSILPQGQGVPEQPGSYLQSFGRGIMKGINQAIDYLAPGIATRGPTLQAPTGEQNPKITNEDINKLTPNAATNVPGGALERFGEGLPTALPFGAAGVAGSGAAALTGAALDKYNPNHPIINAGAELLSSVAAAPLTNILSKTVRSIPERFGVFQSPINKLYSDFAAKSRVAGANSGPEFLQQIQNGLREGLGGRGTIIRSEDELFNAVERQANTQFDRLGPEMSRYELGRATQAAAEARGPQIKTEISNLSNALSSVVPSATSLAPTNYFNTLATLEAKYAGAQAQQPLFQPKIKSYIDRLLTDLSNSSNAANPMGTIPYEALKNMRTDIGEMIEKGIFNPDQSTKELRSLYRALSEDMRSAYPNTRAQAVFDHVNALQEGYYNNLENIVQPLIKQGLTPETLAQRILNQAQKGPTTLQNTVGELENVNPNIRNIYTSQILRSFGENRIGEFDPRLFYTNFKKLETNAPETIDFLFQGQAKAREGVEKLAEMSGLIRESFASRNTSGTTPTLHVLGTISRFITGLSTLAGGGAGAAIGHTAGEDIAMTMGAGIGAGVGHAMAVPLDLLGNHLLAKLWTSPMFNTWIATEGTKLKPSIAVLGALGTEEPDLESGLKALGNFFQMQGQQKNTRGFLGGGLVDFPEQSSNGYAQGGISHNTNDPRPSYNPQLPRVAAGLAAGGEVANENERQGPNILDFFLGQHKPLGGGGLGGPRVSPMDQLVKEITDTIPMGGTPKAGFSGSQTTKRGAQWDFKANEWQPPFDENISNDQLGIRMPKNWFTNPYNYAEGGAATTSFQKAVDYYKANLGLTDEQARGAVKYMAVNESRLDPNIVNPTSGALGMAQWLGPRKQSLLSQYGPSSTLDQQLEFSVKELLGPERKTLETIRNAKTEKQAYDIWGSLYERPGQQALAKAGVNYKSSDVKIPETKLASAKIEEKPKSIVEQFLLPTNEGERQEETQTNDTAPIIETLNAVPWVTPETKLAARRILTENA